MTTKHTRNIKNPRPVAVTLTFAAETDIARDILRRPAFYEGVLSQGGLSPLEVHIDQVDILPRGSMDVE